MCVALPCWQLGYALAETADPLVLLKTHIERDVKRLAKPFNNVNTRQTRADLKKGLLDLSMVIGQLEKRYGKDRKMIHELKRILEEEKTEASITRISHRYRKGLQNMLKNNLEVKRRVSDFLEKGVPFE